MNSAFLRSTCSGGLVVGFVRAGAYHTFGCCVIAWATGIVDGFMQAAVYHTLEHCVLVWQTWDGTVGVAELVVVCAIEGNALPTDESNVRLLGIITEFLVLLAAGICVELSPLFNSDFDR